MSTDTVANAHHSNESSSPTSETNGASQTPRSITDDISPPGTSPDDHQDSSVEHNEVGPQASCPADDLAEDKESYSDTAEADLKLSGSTAATWQAVNAPATAHPTEGGRGLAVPSNIKNQGMLDGPDPNPEDSESDLDVILDGADSDDSDSEVSEEHEDPLTDAVAGQTPIRSPDNSQAEDSDSGVSEEVESPNTNGVADKTPKGSPANSQAGSETSSAPHGDKGGSPSSSLIEVSPSSAAEALDQGPERVKSILGTTVAIIAATLKSAGLSTDGNKQAITERLTIYQAGLEESEYGSRCTALYKLKTEDLKARLKALGADFKSKIKSELVELALRAEAEWGGYPCLSNDEELNSEEDSPIPTKKGIKRKCEDNTTPDTVKKVRFSEDEAQSADAQPPAASEGKAVPRGVKRKHRDEDIPASSSESANIKRQKRQSKAAKPTSHTPAKAPGSKPIVDLKTKECNHSFVMDSEWDTKVLFDYKPCSVAVFNAAFRIFTGTAQENDVATVWEHRRKLPILQAYQKDELDRTIKTDMEFIAIQKWWEVLELDAVRVSIGDDFDPEVEHADDSPAAVNSCKKTAAASAEGFAAIDVGESAGVSDQEDSEHVPKSKSISPIVKQLDEYYRRLKSPESDEVLRKEQKSELRKRELHFMKKSKTQIADPAFKEVRKYKEY